jgi:hypothetical protein
MPEQPFTIDTSGAAGSIGFRYDGPFGPLLMESATTHDGYSLTGPSIGPAALVWPDNPHPEWGEAYLAQRLDYGIRLHVDGRDLRLHRRDRWPGLRRSSRAIRIVDENGAEEPLLIRLRGRSSRGITLETATGTQLVRGTGRQNGVVFDPATPGHVAIWLLAWGSGLSVLLTFTL